MTLASQVLSSAGFILSSACVHKINEHADDVIRQIAWLKLGGFAGYVMTKTSCYVEKSSLFEKLLFLS